ncbi:protein Dok-7-like isoform X3 [Oryzias latipes]|uniref:Docking protein 7 n=1 Tax=Oryzias latipes TaxID=8090 RepID=A0A3B3HMV4_ORYLA|nr:protein Dok-7-like isoform X3 [Oryzias latipes]
MTDTVVAEGQVKFRDGKKWKTRWVVLHKPSPVADCLTLLVYKKKKRRKSSRRKEKLSITLEDVCGVEPGPGFDGVSYTLSILCLAHTPVLGFSSRDALLAWDANIRYSLGEVYRFCVTVEAGTKLESGPASLHLCNNLLVLSRGLPPAVIGHWRLSALRQYGAVPHGFVFEGGTRCGPWAGVFFLSCSEGEQISFLFDCMVRGVSPSRARHGRQPKQPADPGWDPASAEKRISLETSELEKRLSMLSHCSLTSSTASTSSCSTSVAGDDHSLSGASSCQSEASYGGRPACWVEPSVRPHLSGEMAANRLNALTRSDDRLHEAVTRPASAQLRPRCLHDCGRQSSLDSGIGITTGSQSSFSSRTASLEMTGQGAGEEYCSPTSLPPPPHPPSSPPCAPPLTPPPLSFQLPEQPSASSCSGASRLHSAEYQIPSLLRLWYETPRRLLQPQTQPPAPPVMGRAENRGSAGGVQVQTASSSRPKAPPQAATQRCHFWGSERAPSVDREGSCTATSSQLFGEIQGCRGLSSYITPEQLISVRSSLQANGSPSADLAPCRTPATHEPPPCVDGSFSEWRGQRRATLSPPPSSAPPPPPVTCVLRPPPSSACANLQLPLQSPPMARLHAGPHRGARPPSAEERLHTEPDLQERSSAPVSRPCAAAGGGALQKPSERHSSPKGFHHFGSFFAP